jgi:hypothetical protein
VHTHCFYQWEDEEYAEFMKELLANLEPRREKAQTVLIEENEEWAEVLFFTKGSYCVGYELNRENHYVLLYRNATQILGMYGCTFDKRAQFVYKTVSSCEGFFIRRGNWKHIFRNHAGLIHSLHAKIKKEHLSMGEKIASKKRYALKLLKKRADYDSISLLKEIPGRGKDKKRAEEHECDIWEHEADDE